MNNTIDSLDLDVSIEIPSGFEAARPGAIARLQYLHPGLSFHTHSNAIAVTGSTLVEVAVLRRDVLHAVYREKIYLETLPMRSAFYDTVLRPCPSGP